DDIREIVDGAQYMPVLGRCKIFIIDEVHMLSKSAFNALLKTLEEPPHHVKFIFATTELRKIPETILSRCMTFHLKSVSKIAIIEHLILIAQKEGITLLDDAASIISEESEGSVRDSLSMLEQAIMLTNNSKTVSAELVLSMLGGARTNDIDSLLTLILDAKTQESLSQAEKLLNNGSDPYMIYKSLQSALYKKITQKVNGEKMDYQLSNLLYLWQILLRQTENMKNSNIPEHILNAAIIITSHTASFPSIEKLMLKDQNIPSSKTTNSENKFANEVLNTFPGSISNDIE
ncbi:MAG: AAA family ATPase, partial [Holosporales bacterium]|nr:AAA family ATPase [Holosporales bacterium]